jgi:hypothetical protein
VARVVYSDSELRQATCSAWLPTTRRGRMRLSPADARPDSGDRMTSRPPDSLLR